MSTLVFSPTISEKSGKSAQSQLQRTSTLESFNHFVLGIWDLYVEKPPVKWRIPFYPLNADKSLLITDLQYLWKAICDLISPLLFARLSVSAALALFPAASLWYASIVT